jgi:hypothetical protein
MRNSSRFVLLLSCFLMLAVNQELMAQKYPWSFMPMCANDELWYISVSDSGKGQGHTLPVFASMRIGRDTLMNTRRYYYVTFPPEIGIDEGWMHADSAGLYVWTGSGDLRLIPSWVSLGETINGGKVTQVTFVPTPFGDARSFTIEKGGKRSTWTDGIGLWSFDRIHDGHYKPFTWIARNTCGSGASHEPAGFLAPMRDGDILVHRLSSEQQPDLGFQILSARKGTDGKEWIAAASMPDGRRESRNFRIGMTRAGMIHYEGNDHISVQPRFDHYPAYLPPLDELTIGSDLMRIVSRFDTTIFSESVTAFTMVGAKSGVDRVMTIADRFGLVYERVQGLETILHSAVVAGIKYNRSQTPRRFLPLCPGSTYAYRRIGPVTDDVVMTSMLDTIAQGLPFVHFGIPAMPGKGGFSVVHAFDGLLREVMAGVVNENGELLLPAAVDLGDRIPTGIAVATGQMEVFGAKRHFLTTVDIGKSGFRVDTLIDNIGLYSTYVSEDFIGTFSWRLLGGDICGNRVGVTSGTTEAYAPTESLDLRLYPNPATVGSTVHIGAWSEVHAHARLLIHDMLGRVVTDESVTLVPGMNIHLRNSGGFAPGMYIVSLTNSAAHVSALLQLR